MTANGRGDGEPLRQAPRGLARVRGAQARDARPPEEITSQARQVQTSELGGTLEGVDDEERIVGGGGTIEVATSMDVGDGPNNE